MKEYIVAYWHLIVTKIRVNSDSGNGVLPDDSVGLSSNAFCGIHMKPISQEVFINMCLEITHKL